ncbi:MAG TPA: M28 family metallopeptidase [Candidatus Acidoferrales bacterium]|nr:M28 family metallopeptidase [Candidatus Acidoferrales bacterium]
MKETRQRPFHARRALGVFAVCAVFSGIALAQVQQNPKAEGSRWWKDVSFLASDDLQGRMTGSGGYQAAAGYVAESFKAEGLKAAGTVGFFQPVKFKSLELDEAYSSIALVQGDKTTPLTLGNEVILRAMGDAADEIEADAVFVGYGISAPEVNYDDLAGLDLHGKIAVYLSGGPGTIRDPLRAHVESIGERWKAMKAAGAIGVASIVNPTNQEVPWERIARNRRHPSLALAETDLGREQGMKISLNINPQDADEFFAGSGHTMAEIIATVKAHQPLPKFPLAVKIHAKIKVAQTDVEAPNVVGELEGSDPDLKKQFVVVSAHLDHLGIGAPVNGDDIYNGAMDNAAGIAALIQIAHDFRVSNTKPKRSVIFLALCGEEEGELGSWYFANHPTVSSDAIAADINMDMFLPLFPLQYLQVQGLDESTLGDDIRAAGKADGVNIIEDEQPEANRFIRSDQYSFVQKGIPALAFKFGYEKGSPQEKTFNDWVHTHYHAPSDDTNQKVDQEAAGKFCYLMYMLADRVADDSARPTWEPTSFFRRFAQEGSHP